MGQTFSLQEKGNKNSYTFWWENLLDISHLEDKEDWGGVTL
jgi:hypothetical protein